MRSSSRAAVPETNFHFSAANMNLYWNQDHADIGVRRCEITRVTLQLARIQPSRCKMNQSTHQSGRCLQLSAPSAHGILSLRSCHDWGVRGKRSSNIGDSDLAE